MIVSTADYLRARPRTLDAYRYIMRTIRRQKLAAGDRLPPQEELRQASSFSHDSLGAAMQILVREGVLTRRAGLGTIVLDPHANHTAVWTVGMTFPPKVESGVSPTVSFLLRQHLHR
ncbi:MAG: GntR family transcriptional regulator, partial [Planctomycetota bacterium]